MSNTVRTAVWNGLHSAAGALGFGMASFRMAARQPDLATIRRIRGSRKSLLTPLEAMQIRHAVRATAKLGGVMAEIGVYQGASARLIRESDTGRPLHLFDTFAGLPATASDDVAHERGQFQAGEFACSVESVRAYLRDLPDIDFHVGLFPASAETVADLRFSFVHLDVDLYESARASIEWLYPRLLPGAILLSHDFATCAGPRRALSDFFDGRPEPLVELSGDQALIVKI